MKIVTSAKVITGGVIIRAGKIGEGESFESITGMSEDGATPIGATDFLAKDDIVFKVLEAGMTDDDKKRLNLAFDQFIAATKSAPNGQVVQAVQDVTVELWRWTDKLMDQFGEEIHATLDAALRLVKGGNND